MPQFEITPAAVGTRAVWTSFGDVRLLAFVVALRFNLQARGLGKLGLPSVESQEVRGLQGNSKADVKQVKTADTKRLDMGSGEPFGLTERICPGDRMMS